jgi:hypothetical protein
LDLGREAMMNEATLSDKRKGKADRRRAVLAGLVARKALVSWHEGEIPVPEVVVRAVEAPVTLWRRFRAWLQGLLP